jgi:hypothetical protein
VFQAEPIGIQFEPGDVVAIEALNRGIPIDVLCNEIRELGLNIQLEKKKGAVSVEDDELM